MNMNAASSLSQLFYSYISPTTRNNNDDEDESLSVQVLETDEASTTHTQEEQSLTSTSTSSTLISFSTSNNLEDGNLCGSWFGDYLSHSNNDDISYNDWSSYGSSSSPSTPPRLASEYSTPTSSPHSISSKESSSCPSSTPLESLESTYHTTSTINTSSTACCDTSASSVTPLEPPRLPAARSSSSAANSNQIGGIFAEPMCLLMTSNKDKAPPAPPPMRELNSTSSSSSTAEGTSVDDDEITVRVSNTRHKNKLMYTSDHETKQHKNNPLHHLIHPGRKDEFTNNAPFQLPDQETRSTTTNTKKPNNSSNVFKKTSRKIKKILGKPPPRRHGGNGHPDPPTGTTPTTISTRTLATHKAVKHGSHRKSQSFDQLWLEEQTRETIVHDDLQDVLMGKPFQVTKASSKGGTRTPTVQQPVEPKSHVRLFPRKRFGSSSDNEKSKPNSPSRKIINLIRQPTSSGGTAGPVETSKTTWDDAIRGRLDGFDVLSLGKARNISFVNKTQKQFAGQRYTLRSMVTDMLWQSCCGSGTPEIVLEGFAPHGEDRWTVCVTKREEDHAGNLTRRSNSTRLDIRTQEQTGSKEDKTHKWKELLPTTQEDHCGGDSWRELLPCCDDKAQFLDDNDMSVKQAQSHKDMQSEMSLSQIMWGSDKHPPPTHSIRYEKSDDPGSNGTQFVAVSSCPIDVDKGTFIIKTNDHLQSVHKAAVAPLMHGRFSESISIFENILKSLKLKYKHIDYLHHLVGSTHHNLGVLYMWSEQYEEALQHFKKAITVRSQIFCFHHPLVAVSLAKIGIVYFALEQLEKASCTFEKAVEIRKKLMQEDHLEIAKLFNNLGAVNYQKGDNKTALKNFTDALQIQKQCLDGIRRESLVHDSSNTLSNLGKVYLDLDDYDMAFYCFEEALMLQTASFRKDHDTILTSLGNIAFAKAKKGETTNALQVYKCLLRTQESKFGSQNRQAVETRGLMSVIYIQQKNHKSGIRCLGSVLQWQIKNLDEHHPAIKNTKETIAKMKQALSTSKT